MNRKVKQLLSLIVTLCFCLSTASLGFASELRFGEDGSFTILHITDTQDDHHPAPEMLKLIRVSIEQTKPDLVVFTGDIVEDKRVGDCIIDDEPWREGVLAYSGTEVSHEKTLKNVKTAVDAVFSIVEQAGVPFAVTQGNNDYKCTVTNEEWLDIYSQYKNCLVSDQSDDSEGRIDYTLGIRSADGERLLFNLYLMDTRSGGVTGEQLAWYETASNALKAQNNGEAVPSFVFEHIPVAEIGNLFEPCKLTDKGAILSGGKYYRFREGVTGYTKFADVPGGKSDQFESWKKQGDVLGAYFGHEHNTGYTGTYNGIELGLTYGAEFAKQGPYGVRVIKLNEEAPREYENTVYSYSGGSLHENVDSYSLFDFLFEAISTLMQRLFVH